MPYLDAQVYHVAGLLHAALGSTLSKAVFRAPQPRPPADSQLPCVCVWRESETWEGTEPGFREFTALFRCKVYMGLQSFGEQLDNAWGSLHDYAKRIDQALILGRHASYESGQDLGDLAGINSVEALEATNEAELPGREGMNAAYPCTTITLRVIHHEIQNPAVENTLTKSYGHFDLDDHHSAAKTATLNAVGPVTATWTPVASGVTVVVATGGAPALAVNLVTRTATVTVVAGTTTYAQIKTAWDANADALKLATLAGAAGTVGAGYLGETLRLWYDTAHFGANAVETLTTY